MPQEAKVSRRGVYNIEYFSGAQVSLYIGDVWVDEVTTLSYGYQQSRTPIYGYASTLFDDVSEGRILVTGQFTINFKEAGYLWLILNRFRELNHNKSSLTAPTEGPFKNSGSAARDNIEQIVNNETSTLKRNRFFQDLAKSIIAEKRNPKGELSPELNQAGLSSLVRASTSASLGGFSSVQRSIAGGQPIDERRNVGKAERKFEVFEDALWKSGGDEPSSLDNDDRRADDTRLNPFEIYVAFGDFAGDNTANHTIERIRNVYILGKSKQVSIDGLPIQEQYSFIGRNIV